MRITGGLLKNRTLFAPKGQVTRPTSERLRQAVFNICIHKVPNARFLDLFAGSGAMGIEALSHGASHATFVDQNKTAIECIKKNVLNLSLLSVTTIMISDVMTALKKLEKKGEQFDLIYVDPPYNQQVKTPTHSIQESILIYLDSSSLLSTEGTLFIEDLYTKDDLLGTLPLKNLSLHSKRKIGSSSLYEYSKKG